MKALQYQKSIPRYVALKLLAPRVTSLYNSKLLLPVALRDIPPPKLPGGQWLRIAPRLAGVCGSDLSTIFAKGSPYLAPFTSMPFVMGHEVLGTVVEIGNEARGFSVGERVVLHPALGCLVRGIQPMCEACSGRRDALCRNVTRGVISKGIQTGYCRDTGGGWGESLVAHQSQLYKVPDNVSDQAAVLVEPFACALHAALRVDLSGNDTVLVLGCGSIGLLTIAALRAIGCGARIVACAKYDHQAQHARALGAEEFIDARGPVRRRYTEWAETLDAEVFEPELGKPTVVGGAEVTFDCVGSSESIDDAIRFTKGGKGLVLVGMPGVPSGVDWTPLWHKELTVRASYAYGPERIGERCIDTFELALEYIGDWGEKLAVLVGQPHELADYRAALTAALNTGTSGVVKTVFVVNR